MLEGWKEALPTLDNAQQDLFQTAEPRTVR